MKPLRTQLAARRHPLTGGFTLVELMVAMAISLFLIGGMLVVLQNVRSTYSTQTKLASLEDSERLAMMLMSDVIQSAGYFPQPLSNTAAGEMPASNNFPGEAGSPAMTETANTQGDTITVRFAADTTSPTLMNCMGQTASTPVDWENYFYVDPKGNLTCQVTNGATNAASNPVILATGLTTNTNATTDPPGMTILYGVTSGTASAPTCMDIYKTSAQMTAADWPYVCAVKVTLTFVNPTPPPDGTKPTVSFTRVIAVMNMAGASA
ncbi:MAG TPA: prepilin-type N-terminal cleavage/methylation domain-containing protein [Steroidobacteraceae bacterium]